MYEFHTTITDEGAALLARIIANQENASFDEARFSDTDYTGQEQTLTALTFGGVFDTNSVYAEIVDSTTIKVSFSILTQAQPHDLYSIGIIMDDNGTDVLVAVCTTADPMPVQQGAGNSYSFNVNLAVSSTSDITVTGTTAAVIYDTDVIDTLISPATNKPLSANQGRLVADNLAAIENVLGAKNLGIPLEEMTSYNLSTSNNSDGSLTVTTNGLTCGGISANWSSPFILKKGTYQVSFGLDTDETPSLTGFAVILKVFSNSYWLCTSGDSVASRKITLAADTEVVWGLYCESGTVVATQTVYPMIRLASIVNPTFAPFTETNLQLTRKTSGLSNENLVDNPFFTVNQRGFVSVATNANRYIIDRWNVSNYTDANGICSLSSSGLTFDNSASAGETELMQKYEHSLDTTKQYTASIKLSNGTIYTASGSLPITVTIPSIGTVNATDTRFKIVISGGASAVTIRAVKLELGTVSTLANDVAPDYTTELLKCQRYFLCVEGLTNGAILGIGTPNSTTTMYAAVPLPTSMRATPTLSYTGTGHILQGSSTMALTNITIDTISNVYAQIIVVSSGLTIGQVGMLRASSGGLKIFLSADL